MTLESELTTDKNYWQSRAEIAEAALRRANDLIGATAEECRVVNEKLLAENRELKEEISALIEAMSAIATAGREELLTSMLAKLKKRCDNN